MVVILFAVHEESLNEARFSSLLRIKASQIFPQPTHLSAVTNTRDGNCGRLVGRTN